MTTKTKTKPVEPPKLLRQVDVPEGTKGNWKVVRQTMTKEEAAFDSIRAMMSGRSVPQGTYTMLYRGGTLVMSDTPDEMRDHREAVYRATGHVLIAGLGIGMVLQACLDKPGVTKVTVIEKSQDVIDLVGPHYLARYGDKLEIIQADALEWTPPKGVRYDAAWFDIWDVICSDNLEQMTKLKRRFARRAAWKGCWAEWQCRRQRSHYAQW